MLQTSEKTKTLPESQLLAKLILDDDDWQAAFTRLFKKHQNSIYRRSLAILKNTDDAEDIVQEVFFLFFRKYHQFKGECSLQTWLLRITENQCFTLLSRKKQQQERHEQLSAYIDQAENVYEDKIYESAELKNTVSKMLKHLDFRAREILSLRYWLDLSVTEIANILGLGLSAGKMRLHRAHQSCPKKYYEYFS